MKGKIIMQNVNLKSDWEKAIDCISGDDDVQIISESGSLKLISRLNPDVQICLTHNQITFTNDNWTTHETIVNDCDITPADVGVINKNNIQLSPNQSEGIVFTAYDESGNRIFETTIGGREKMSICKRDSTGQLQEVFNSSSDGEIALNGTISSTQ